MSPSLQIRSEKPPAGLAYRLAPPPGGSSRSAVTKANASGWNTSDCGLAVVARVPPAGFADQTVMAAPLAGALETFWSAPVVMIGGESGIVMAPVVSTMSDV